MEGTLAHQNDYLNISLFNALNYDVFVYIVYGGFLLSYTSVRGLDTADPILAKFGIDIVLDPKHKPPYFYFIFSKSKTAAGS